MYICIVRAHPRATRRAARQVGNAHERELVTNENDSSMSFWVKGTFWKDFFTI